MRRFFSVRIIRCLPAFLGVLFFLIQAEYGFSQNSVIRGKVVDKEDASPVPFANVYFNNSLIGTTTDANGRYILRHLDAGMYEFIVSFVGYESFRKFIRIGEDDTLNLNVTLTRSVEQLSEIQIKAKVDAEWKRNYRKFEYQFFGPNVKPRDCEITNPGYLIFHDNPKTDSFTAESKVPLIIMNHRLGYRIYFTLRQFVIYKGNLSIYSGDARFEKLTATTSQELLSWEINRYNTYKGSLRNLFHDMIFNTLDQDGFKVYQVQPNISFFNSNYFSERVGKEFTPVDPKLLVYLSGNPNSYFIQSMLPIEVVYTGRYSSASQFPDMPYEVSRIILKTNRIEVNKNGFAYNPTAFIVTGNRAGERAADMLPFEYQPPRSDEALAGTDLNEVNFHKIDSLSQAISDQGLIRDQENVLISTDKPYYIAGDELWYSIRLVDDFSRHPEEGDRIVYVDLVTPGDSVTVHQTLPCVDGLASGRMDLPGYLPEGCYMIRGYTDWMRNFSDAGYSGKTILIHSDVKSSGLSDGTTSVGDSIIMKFFPEGGNLLDGLNSAVGIHATDISGQGVMVNGSLTDERGREIARIATSALGIGKVNFKPRFGRNYYAKISYVNMRAANHRYLFPEVSESGFKMAVLNQDRNMFTVNVEATPDLKNHGVILIIQAGGNSLYHEAFYLVGTEKTLLLQKSKFPAGPVQLNLFTLNGNLIGQRMIYIDHPNEYPLVTIKASKPEYDPAEQVDLQINLKDYFHHPVSAIMSVSVTANDMFDPVAYTDPVPEIMLQSEFFEGIQNPRYYFRDTTTATREDRDNLMLTLTHYKYDWRQFNNESGFPYAKDKTLPVSGTVYENKRVCDDCQVTLFPVTQGMNYRNFTTDQDGKFKINIPGLFDSASFIVDITNRKGRKINGHISVDREIHYKIGKSFRDCTIPVEPESIEKYDTVLQYVKTENEKIRTLMMKEIAISAKRIEEQPVSTKLIKSDVYSNPDQVINLDDNKTINLTVTQILARYLTGFMITPDGQGNYKFLLHGPHSFNVQNESPLFIVDGVELGNSQAYTIINSLNPNNIQRIEVFKDASAGYWGVRGADGVIAIFTKHGVSYNFGGEKNGHKKLFEISGFTPQANFRMVGEDSTSLAVTQRVTVYWAGNLSTGPDGNIELKFDNASNARFFTVHVQGITSDGVPFSYATRTDH